MKNIFLCTLCFLIYGCNKKHIDNNKLNFDYYDKQYWKNQDSDQDGYLNQEELDLGLNPNLINGPNFNKFSLVNVIFSAESGKDIYNFNPIQLEVDGAYYNKFFLEKILPRNQEGVFPFQNKMFEKEHLSIETDEQYPDPLLIHLKPRIDSSFTNLVSKIYDPLKNPAEFFNNLKNIVVTFTLNFPTDLTSGPWSNIDGEIQWGKNIGIWHWSKNNDPKIHWKFKLEKTDFDSIFKSDLNVKLKITSWDFLTPFGVKSMSQDSLKNLIPFFTINNGMVLANWYDEKNPLPSAKTVQQPTADNDESLPWFFLKLNNNLENKISYWLKELLPIEQTWLSEGKNFKSTYIHAENNDDHLPLPPHALLRGLKISTKRHAYTIRGVPQQIYAPKFHCLVKFIYPGDKIHYSDKIDLDRFFSIFKINQQNIKDLKEQNVYYTFEKDIENNEIKSITIHWPPNFKWINFSINGLKDDYFVNTYEFNKYCLGITDIDWGIAWYASKLPLYKSEIFEFEWLF